MSSSLSTVVVFSLLSTQSHDFVNIVVIFLEESRFQVFDLLKLFQSFVLQAWSRTGTPDRRIRGYPRESTVLKSSFPSLSFFFLLLNLLLPFAEYSALVGRRCRDTFRFTLLVDGVRVGILWAQRFEVLSSCLADFTFVAGIWGSVVGRIQVGWADLEMVAWTWDQP